MQTIEHGTLRIELDEVRGAFYAKAWRGKARKPFANYRFRSAQDRDGWIAKWRADEDAREEYKQKRAAVRAADAEKMRARIQVGTILHYSWGWEQTNCEFYLVVERKGASCVIRECGSTQVPGSGYAHGMAEMLRPDPERVFGEPMRKTIGPVGLTMTHGIASPCERDSEHYHSWYA